MDVWNLLLLGVAIRCLDGGRMQIKSPKFRFRKRFRHEEGGDAMTASDVRDTNAEVNFCWTPSRAGIHFSFMLA